jgi:threonine aldolase
MISARKAESGDAMDYIDLRSDAVTRPTDEMREAMARAEVGDDVYLEDPTVNRLQELAAEIVGKEAALFVPSGTMGNVVCITLHTQPGQEVITEERSHIFNAEMAAMASISGALARPVRGEDGILDWPTVATAIRQGNCASQTGLITLENTHSFAGGTVMPLRRLKDICDRAHERGIPVHLDGARIFNAGIALKRDVRDLVAPVDSVMFCLSKGLGAPIGSMIAGSREFIDRALSVRRMFGGSMRQAGVVAAAGLIALSKMTTRLEEDHLNACLVAHGLAQLPGVRIDPERVQTNIVVFDIQDTGMSSDYLSARLKERGVLAGGINPREMRMVTHKDVSRKDCETSLEITAEVFVRSQMTSAGKVKGD